MYILEYGYFKKSATGRRIVMTDKYRAIDIANYILWYAGEKGHEGLTALKLQKILYYVVTGYLKKTGEFLFNEKIEKWRYGPVIPSVYHTFKNKKYGLIKKPISNFIEVEGKFVADPFNPNNIDKDTQTIIENIVDRLIDCTAFELVEKTHKEPAWRDYKSLILESWDNPTYTKEELLAATD
ncbi:hypothetical protein B9T19_04385 [Ignatzschineria sp. F8392]|nr:hypothetical protein B9T19_04385 [Ignatzschineria sp. F8392]